MELPGKELSALRKPGHIFFIIICLCLLVCCAADAVPRAYAASSMTASEDCVEFVKKVEGFSAKPYYDYSQHTVGYGTKCPTEKYFDYMVNGIPRDEAEVLLRETLAEVSDAVNKKLMDPYQLTFTQHQFDALVSFSFNIGTAWMTYDSTLRNAILRNAGADELVYAFSLYCTAGGNYSSGLINRRLCEANMFLNGVYSQSSQDAYGYVFYDPNGGSLTYRVQGFLYENHPAPAADAVRSGDVFLGWYTDLIGGSQVTELTKTLSGNVLFARWQSSESSENLSSTVIRVTGDVVNIRKGPGTGYGISRQVYTNDALVVSHVTYLSNRKWGKVQDGWICLDYTNYDAVLNGTGNTDTEINGQPSQDAATPDQPAGNDSPTDTGTSPGTQNVVSGIVRVNDLLRIRSGPGTAYSTVGRLVNGTAVEILEQQIVESTVWGRIARGWVSMDYIITDRPANGEPEQTPEQESPESYPNTEATAIKGIITADALRIRSGPGTAYSIAGFYYQKEWVVVSETVTVDSVRWGKTDKGWINLDYVQTGSANEEAALPTQNGVMTVIADCLRVRKEIGTQSRIAALLYYGDSVTVLETKTVDGILWGRVYNGWICMDYVK